MISLYNGQNCATFSFLCLTPIQRCGLKISKSKWRIHNTVDNKTSNHLTCNSKYKAFLTRYLMQQQNMISYAKLLERTLLLLSYFHFVCEGQMFTTLKFGLFWQDIQYTLKVILIRYMHKFNRIWNIPWN